jgi:hypothetical protein
VYLPWISHTDFTESPCISRPGFLCISHPGFSSISLYLQWISLISDLAVFPLNFPVSLIQDFPIFLMDLLLSHIQDFPVFLSVYLPWISPRISHPRSRCISPGFSCISHSEFPCFSNGYACISHPGFSSISHVSRLDHRVFPMDISFWISMYFPGSLCNSLRSCIFLFLSWICIHPSRIFLNLTCISPGSRIRGTNKPVSVCNCFRIFFFRSFFHGLSNN